MSQDNNNNEDNNTRAQRRALSDLTIPLYQVNSHLENRNVTQVLPDFTCAVNQEAFNASAAGQRQSKGWVWVVNNPTIRVKDALELNVTDPIILDVAYSVWAKEVGEERGTPHIQGYVRFERKKRAYQVVRDFIRYWEHGCWPHFIVARAGDAQNREYCTKAPLPFSENDPVPYVREIGE